jgi:hypothetical protein
MLLHSAGSVTKETPNNSPDWSKCSHIWSDKADS